MKPLRKFHLDLQACELEDRVLPVIANLGVIVLTTGGYVLMIPSPGIAIPTSFFMTGSGGISSIQPGNNTGVPSLAATGTAGSGANDATAASIPLVTRNTIANDALNARPRIGRPSGDLSPILPVGQFYRGGVPETAPAPGSSETPGEQSNRSSRQRPVDSSPIRLGSVPARLHSTVLGNFMKTHADRMQ
jgi:hypothetical protein